MNYEALKIIFVHYYLHYNDRMVIVKIKLKNTLVGITFLWLEGGYWVFKIRA